MNSLNTKIGLLLFLILPITGGVSAGVLIPPETIAPLTKAKISLGTEISYQWKPSEGATHYDFRLRDSWNQTSLHQVRLDASVVCTEVVCSYSTPELVQLSEVGRFVWQVRARSGGTKSTYTRNVLFMSGELPDQPLIVSPADMTNVELPEPLSFQWQASEGAIRYILIINEQSPKSRVYRNAQILASACDPDTSLCSFELPEEVKLGAGDYEWFVRATNGVDRSTFTRTNLTVNPVPGTLTAGYDWELPAYASDNPSGGLVRGKWSDKDRDYTNTAFYSLRWNDVPYIHDPDHPDANEDGYFYDFGGFNWWLGSSEADGDNVLVRLEVNSLCDAPVRLRSTFNYYAGGSIAFWHQHDDEEDSYVSELKRFVDAFAAKYADNPRLIGMHLGIADGEYKHIEEGNYHRLVDGEYQDDCRADLYDEEDGWGEFWVDEAELSHAMQQGLTTENLIQPENFTPSVTQIINNYASAFEGNTAKLAMTNIGNFAYNDEKIDLVPVETIKAFNDEQADAIVPLVNSLGIGNRDGLVEDWMSYNDPSYGIEFTAGPDNTCHLSMNETFAENIGNRYWGTENEEYGNDAWLIERYGAYEGQPYRFLMSSMRALQMRRNHMAVHTPGMDGLPQTDYNTADFVHYLASTIGRDKTNTPDAFVMLGERYIRPEYINGFEDELASVESCLIRVNDPDDQSKDGEPSHEQVREFGRWLTEVGGKGVKAKQQAFEMEKEPWSIPAYLPEVNGSTKYEYAARDSHEFTFDINDAVLTSRCPADTTCELTVKVVFEDTVATTLSLQTETGTLASLDTVGDGATKTATFTVSEHFRNEFNGADFGLKTGLEEESLPVMMVRVNFMQDQQILLPE